MFSSEHGAPERAHLGRLRQDWFADSGTAGAFPDGNSLASREGLDHSATAREHRRMTKIPLRALIVEDSEFDAQMMVSILRKGGYDVTFARVETASALQQELARDTWQVILADYNLPEFDAAGALRILQDSGRDVPFLIVSGGIGEDVAVAAMKAGAHDYVMKGSLGRLVPAVERELREAAVRASQRKAEQALQERELRLRLLWESCPDAVILMDTGSRIHFANPAVKDVFGYTPEEVVGQSLSMLQPPSLRGGHQAGMARYLGTGVRKLNWRATETTGLRKDGMEVPIEVSFADMELNGERRFVGFVRDITERKRAERELRENQEQFRVAREIQQRLFPKTAPTLAGFDIAGATYPAEATGGDYFDYLPMLHDRLGLVIGDVTGHGVGPALLMAETRAYLRVLAGRREDPGEILTRTNGILAEDVGDERFVTLLLARIDPVARTLVYSSAGHPAGYVFDTAGQVRQTLPRTAIPLGMRADTQFASAPEIHLQSGDMVLLLTDGIEETTSLSDELFGLDRILEVARAQRARPAREIVDAIYAAVRTFAGRAPQADDVTLIVAKCTY
jgi:PAS domain S-box-containing protein